MKKIIALIVLSMNLSSYAPTMFDEDGWPLKANGERMEGLERKLYPIYETISSYQSYSNSESGRRDEIGDEKYKRLEDWERNFRYGNCLEDEVGRLLREGADANQTNPATGRTPLADMIKDAQPFNKRRVAIIKKLINGGARFHNIDAEGKNFCDLLEEARASGAINKLEHFAIIAIPQVRAHILARLAAEKVYGQELTQY